MASLPFFKKKPSEAQAAPQPKPPAQKAVVGLSAVGILKYPHVTEKASMLASGGEYVFEVYPRANALEVRRAVEKTYGVNVVKVNMLNIPPKVKRVGRRMGKTKAVRKAIVQLQKGQSIELMPR